MNLISKKKQENRTNTIQGSFFWLTESDEKIFWGIYMAIKSNWQSRLYSFPVFSIGSNESTS